MYYKLTLQLYRHTRHLCQKHPNSPVIYGVDYGREGWLFATPAQAMHHLLYHATPYIRGQRATHPSAWPPGALLASMAGVSICRVVTKAAPNRYPVNLFASPQGGLSVTPYQRYRKPVKRYVCLPPYMQQNGIAPLYTKYKHIPHTAPHWLSY